MLSKAGMTEASKQDSGLAGFRCTGTEDANGEWREWNDLAQLFGLFKCPNEGVRLKSWLETRLAFDRAMAKKRCFIHYSLADGFL